MKNETKRVVEITPAHVGWSNIDDEVKWKFSSSRLSPDDPRWTDASERERQLLLLTGTPNDAEYQIMVHVDEHVWRFTAGAMESLLSPHFFCRPNQFLALGQLFGFTSSTPLPEPNCDEWTMVYFRDCETSEVPLVFFWGLVAVYPKRDPDGLKTFYVASVYDTMGKSGAMGLTLNESLQ